MATRKIVEIDRDKCNGCGLCTTACAEGALALDAEGKAILVREIFCDGLGACLDVCPVDALKVVERESEEYDAQAAFGHVLKSRGAAAAKSRLSQWPIQLHLISPLAPTFEGSDLLVAADCTAFALGGFHEELLEGKKLVIACPKLDETQGYVEKLAELIKRNDLHSLTVAIMTVPCCSGLERIVRLAVELSGVALEVKKVVVGIDGKIVQAP
jgi:NAD-dependent dihydropyrimidine dehydrogenase PreA subunit